MTMTCTSSDLLSTEISGSPLTALLYFVLARICTWRVFTCACVCVFKFLYMKREQPGNSGTFAFRVAFPAYFHVFEVTFVFYFVFLSLPPLCASKLALETETSYESMCSRTCV